MATLEALGRPPFAFPTKIPKTPSQFLGTKLELRHPFESKQRNSSFSSSLSVVASGVGGGVVDLVHNLFVGVGVGLPCTVMECGDIIYRSTLPRSNGVTVTAPGVVLALGALSYLWATPGVAPGFWDMFVLAFVERFFRPTFRKDDFVLGKKLGEGAFGVVYRVSNKLANKEGDLVLKKATEYGAVEIWMNERVRRACSNSCADFVHGFLETSSKKGNEYWLIWRFEGDATLADLMLSKDFPYNVETKILGEVQDLPKGLERENKIIQTIMRQLLFALDGLHSTGIVHRDIKPQNIIFSEGSRTFKIIDLGAAADLRVGINYIPKEFLLDPRYAAPEQYIMSTQTPSAPSAPVAAALSPVLWQMNLPDRFDIYSVGLIFLQMAFPSLRTDSGLIQFNRQLKRCGYDLVAWRKSLGPRTSLDLRKGFELLDLDGGIGWELLTSMVRYHARQRTSAKASLAHPYFDKEGLLVLSFTQKLRLQLFRATQQDYSEATNWVINRMAKSGTKEDGGFTEAQLQDFREMEPKKKGKPQRNALASVLRLQRKILRTLSESMDELSQRKKKRRETKMDDSGAVLCQISYLKDMLDQVNEGIEENIQTTREIESEILKCSEIEIGLATRESELMKMKWFAEYEINGLLQVGVVDYFKFVGCLILVVAKNSVEVLEKEVGCMRVTSVEAGKRMADKREAFIMQCTEFQREINNGNSDELMTLLSEKKVLENENYNLNEKVNALKNSTSAFVEEILEELRSSNSDMHGSKSNCWEAILSACRAVTHYTPPGLHKGVLSIWYRGVEAITGNRKVLSIQLGIGSHLMHRHYKDRWDPLSMIHALQVEISCRNSEYDKLLEDIDDLRSSLLVTSSFERHILHRLAMKIPTE
ncbi:hypothetical protein GIB67_036278 [Kingdonia uniflora]|uniref:non-specific serine/threonine protein kinase n=1 Tax=Kingdonia uniflora TaxID=39325 RepID=A0A7J7L3N8_9MAGN|nr:hypothetical protein GIB67_036278 [Kingdonia uniflora]